jgi:Uncharacterized conserved protein
MAVHIDVEAFRDAIPAPVAEAAARLRSGDGVGELEPVGGGVQAVVRDGTANFQPWVGIVDGVFTGDCDCAAAEDDLCAHAVAVALTAFDADVTFSGAATPPGAASDDPERTEYLRAVRRLAPRQLANLVVEQALQDRLFATLLLGEAGMLDATDQSGLADFRAAIQDASNATTGRWEIHDVETAGQRLAAEVEILCARPATVPMLDLVEEAILVWDDLSGHLHDAYHVRRIDPEEVSEPLVDAHRDLCERLNLDPDEIAERLTRLVDQCHYDTVDTGTYTDLFDDHAEAIGRSAHR